MDHLLDLMKPENIHQIKARQDIEDAILSLFTQLVRDEREYKTKLGKKFIKIAKDRLGKIKEFKFIQCKHTYMVLDQDDKEQLDPAKLKGMKEKLKFFYNLIFKDDEQGLSKKQLAQQKRERLNDITEKEVNLSKFILFDDVQRLIE